MPRDEKIGIVGSGFIGRSWAMLFAGVGYDVCLYDVKEEQVSAALKDIKVQLHNLQTSGLLRGKLTADQQLKCIRGVTSLKDCVQSAKYIQECVFEDLELKKKLWKEIDTLVGPKTILASSTSCILPSLISPDLIHKTNFIVSHPVNPPYYVPATEVVPAPWTSKDVVAATRDILAEIGQSPVVFNREIAGFGVNRLQYALMNECNNLVRAGVVSVKDVDTLMKDGLGHRYAFMGPLETALLNANGMDDYLQRYAAGMHKVTETFERNTSWEVEDCKDIINQLHEMVPVDQLPRRRVWRDGRLAALAKLKKNAAEEDCQADTK